MAFTYQTLKKEIEDYTLRTDFPYDTFLKLATNEILRRLRTNLMRERYEVTLGDTDTYTVELPPNFLELVSLRDSEGMDIASTRVGKNLRFHIAQKNKTIIADYYFRPSEITANDNSNPIIEAYPTVYFYAVMSQFYSWSNDTENLMKYAQLAVSEIDTINSESDTETKLAQDLTQNLEGEF